MSYDCAIPDGLTVVRGDGDHEGSEAEKFLEPMHVRKIPGVGPKTEERLKKLGVRTVRDAKRIPEAELEDMLGKWGRELYQKFRGRDDSPLLTRWEPKSVGEQETFARDVPVSDRASDHKMLTDALAALAADVHRRLLDEIAGGQERSGGSSSSISGTTLKTFRAVAIIVRFADFTTKTRVVTLPKPIAAADPAALPTIQFQALRLFMPFLDRRENPERKAIRLLGVLVERLE